jgi:hypothetical protein
VEALAALDIGIKALGSSGETTSWAKLSTRDRPRWSKRQSTW